MSQLTLYLDDATRARIERAAKRADTSVSQWVKERLVEALERTWPKDYSALFGSLADTDIVRPDEPSLSDDLPRKRIR